MILENTHPKDTMYDVQTAAESGTVLFVTKGRMVVRDKETKEMLDEYVPGAFLTEWKDGLSEVASVEETVLFCLTPKLNRGYIPEVAPVILQDNEADFFEAGTKFFLCQGTAEVNGAEFTGPCQIGFKGTQSLKAKTEVYGLIVK